MHTLADHTLYPVRYQDRWIKGLCIPVWAIFFRNTAEPAQLIELLRSAQYYIDIAYIMLVSFLLWQLQVTIIKQLDRRLTWAIHPERRLLWQAALAYGSTILLIVLFAILYYGAVLLDPRPLNLSYLLLTEIPLSLLFVTIIHLLYTGLWMIYFHRQRVAVLEKEITLLEKPLPGNKPEKPAGEALKRTLVANQGKGFVPLPVEQVAYIFLANELSVVKTLNGQSFSVDGSLEQLTEQLPPQDFFRISRQFIVQRRVIRKVESETSGRLLLHLQPEHGTEVTVSRRRAPEFKLWMEE